MLLQAEVETTSNVGSVQCDVCKILIGYVQQEINNNSTEVRWAIVAGKRDGPSFY